MVHRPANRLMLHAGSCGYCDHQGWLGFYVGGDGKTMVLICDECDTTYLSPDLIDSGLPVRVGEAPGYLIGSTGISVAGGRDATREEIEMHGWAGSIKGEYAYYAKGSR